MPVQRDLSVPARVSRPPAPEWAILQTQHPHVLITGPFDSTEAAVAALMPALRPPVYCWAPDAALPASHEVTTLLIRDVATVPLNQQHALFSWLDHAGHGRVQVVSTTALELFPLIEHGVFLEALYYRLNTVRLDVARSQPHS